MEVAIEEATKSSYKIKLGAVIFSGKKVISTGYNGVGRSARNLHPRFQNWHGSIHAEVDAILKAKTDLKRTKLLVVRYSPVSKNLLLAKPCFYCESYMRYVGIRKVYFSIPTYPYIEEFNI